MSASVLAFSWETFGAGVLAALLLVGAVLGALGQIGRAVRGVRAHLKPEPPRVTLYGPGAATPRKRDATGWVIWGEVTPWFKIENNEPDAIYDATTGIERPSTGERVTFAVEFPSIPAHGAHTVESDHARSIPPEWLDGYVGESPHKQIRYWVRFLDRNRRRWELLHDPQDLPPRVSRIRR